jgi:hypothetical protein
MNLIEKYLGEKVIVNVNLEKMSDKEILRFYFDHNKSNFKTIAGNLFTSLMDEIKMRNLTRRLTNKNLKDIEV